jgi:hypothetical protein
MSNAQPISHLRKSGRLATKPASEEHDRRKLRLDLLNARLDQSPQLSRIQAWRAFRDELEHQNHKWANRSDDVPPLPADEITPREHTQHDMRQVGLVLLMFLSWLVYFVGPAVISDVPSDRTMSATDYYGLVPALAVALTGAALAGRKQKDE